MLENTITIPYASRVGNEVLGLSYSIKVTLLASLILESENYLMNLFLAICWHSKGHPEIDPRELRPYVPGQPDDCLSWKSPNAMTEAHCYVYWPQWMASGSHLVKTSDCALLFDGNPLPPEDGQGNEAYASALWKSSQCEFEDLSGEYCILRLDNDGIMVATHPGGTMPVFYVRTGVLTAFSNRIALLLQLPGVSTELDVEGAKWLIYQGYTQHGHTSFRDVRRLPTGAKAICRHPNRLRIDELDYPRLVDQSLRELYERDLNTCFESHLLKLTEHLRRTALSYPELRYAVPLSGGKDSRLVLSLLVKGGLKEQISSIYTNGPLYHPDVIAAQEVCRAVEYEPHQINRPPLIKDVLELQMRVITATVNLTQGGISTHDFIGYSPVRPHIALTGHQNALRDNYFSRCPTNNLSAFIESIQGQHFHDPVKLLRNGIRDAFFEGYRAIFRSYAEEGAPIQDLGDLYMMRERNGNWVSAMCLGATLAGPVCNPLLLGDVFRFVFSLPNHIRTEELYHFFLMHLSMPALLRIPFCNDQWTDELRDRLKGIAEVPVVAPYRSHRAFPSASNPYVSSAKMEYFQRMKPPMRDMLQKHDSFLADYLDMDQARNALRESTDVLLPEMICVMGLYTTLLLLEYGADLFHQQREREIADELDKRVRRTVTIQAGATTREGKYEDILERHEESIAALVKDIQGLSGPAPRKHAASFPWRHICIQNQSERNLSFSLSYDDPPSSRLLGTKSVPAGGTFAWGVQFPKGSLTLRCEETGFSRSVTIDPSVLKYYVDIEPKDS